MGIAYVPGLVWIAALFFIGIVISLVSQKLKIPDIILLLLVGIILSIKGYTISNFFPESYLLAFTVFALILIVFDSASNLKISEVLDISPIAVKLSVVFLLLNVLILTFFTQLIFFNIKDFSTIYISVVFSAIMAGTSPEVLSSFTSVAKHKVLDILSFESIINDPITLIFPIIIFNVYTGALKTNSIVNSFIQQVLLGVLFGFMIGYVAFNLLRLIYSNEDNISPLILVALSLGTFVLAEELNGDGILAVTTLAIMFANAPIREKFELQKFSNIFANFLRVVLFILLGLIIKLQFSLDFIINSLALFFILLLIRFLSVELVCAKSNFTLREKIFMTLNIPKGITTAILLIIISTLFLAEDQILNLGLIFIIYSIILGSISIKFANSWLNINRPKLEDIKSKPLK
ncbi:cation:proton antiporter [Candidatus Woesearchaeota archaeon]|nr:cation:proton antiporter [Candidatus Woesearchaeota archaeon]